MTTAIVSPTSTEPQRAVEALERRREALLGELRGAEQEEAALRETEEQAALDALVGDTRAGGDTRGRTAARLQQLAVGQRLLRAALTEIDQRLQEARRVRAQALAALPEAEAAHARAVAGLRCIEQEAIFAGAARIAAGLLARRSWIREVERPAAERLVACLAALELAPRLASDRIETAAGTAYERSPLPQGAYLDADWISRLFSWALCWPEGTGLEQVRRNFGEVIGRTVPEGFGPLVVETLEALLAAARSEAGEERG